MQSSVQVLEKLQGELSTEHAAKLSAEMELRQLKIEVQKQKADLEHHLSRSQPTGTPKLNKTGSIGARSLVCERDSK